MSPRFRPAQGMLRGLATRRVCRASNRAHVREIEALQPDSGCAWTGRLKEISNPDKHRTLAARRTEVPFSAADAVGGHPTQTIICAVYPRSHRAPRPFTRAQ